MDCDDNLSPRGKQQTPRALQNPLRRRRTQALMFGTAAFFGGLLILLQPADEASASRHEFITHQLPLPQPHALTAPLSDATLPPVRPSNPAPDKAGFASENPAAEDPLDTDASTEAAPVSPVSTDAVTNETAATPELPWQEITVRSGDSLSTIFSRLQLGAGQLHALMHSDPQITATLRKIRPGQTLGFRIDEQQQLQALRLDVDRLNSLKFEKTAEGFVGERLRLEPEQRLAHSSAIIKSSLFVAGQRAGLSDAVIMDLATIFGWDIDFALDIRGGDSFTVLYEQLYLDGEHLHDGNILAAEFINQGRTYRAIRFEDEQGNANFFTPEGLSMRKAFLRSPVDFRRISSGFQPARHHPVLGVKRPHRGVDYAAATGTPIKASGDGKVEFIGTKGGYGKVIILQHGGAYRTLYAHMSGFKSGLRTGSRVKQGQTIGFVGMTGMATGPHLHYEFLVNGVHQNPLTVKLPTANPIAEKHREKFLRQAARRVAQLENIKQTTLALHTDASRAGVGAATP